MKIRGFQKTGKERTTFSYAEIKKTNLLMNYIGFIKLIKLALDSSLLKII